MSIDSLIMQYGYFFYDDNQTLIKSADEITWFLKKIY